MKEKKSNITMSKQCEHTSVGSALQLLHYFILLKASRGGSQI